MSSLGSVKTVLFLTGSLLLATTSQSFALSLIAPAYGTPVSAEDSANTPVSAFSNGSDPMGSGSVVLSSDEIEHIRSCAQRYPSYHATDNTYSDASGARVECRRR